MFSVFVDRVIGLIVLVLMGGTAATIQWLLVRTRSRRWRWRAGR